MSDAPVLVHRVNTACGHSIGVLTLNVPKTLNSLNSEMVEILIKHLTAWAEDSSIKVVVLNSSGDRALCAGGDIKALREMALNGDQGRAFFAREYTLDHLIHSFPKPLIAWGKGVVMGGGVGLLAGAPYRVVTDSTRFAMPEVTIGLYPDVGGTYFLARAPKPFGLFMGLTGCSINGADAVAVGFADYVIADEFEATLLDRLSARHYFERDADQIVTEVLQCFAEQTVTPPPVMMGYANEITELCEGEHIGEVVDRITAYSGDARFLSSAAKKLANGSPMTAHLVWEQLQRGGELSLADVFRLEWVMSINCLSAPDFVEGVRALIIDKDGEPKWQHRQVSDITEEEVAAYFTLDEVNPLAGLK